VSGVEDERSVEEHSTATADPAFHDRVRAKCLDPDALAGKDRVDACERRVPFADQEPEPRRTLAEIYDKVASLLSA
jgi:hypothetical protein